MSDQLNIAQTLLVSQLELSFPPTVVGDEQFALLKVGQEGTDTPIQIRIEGTDAFQIAVQGSPLRFYSKLTFVPAPGGTYVHVQFAPKQAGHHITELLIDTSYGTQPLSLSGRTTGLLGRRLTPSSQRQLAAGSSVDQPAYEPTTSKSWLKILALVVFLCGSGALAYQWYTNGPVSLPLIPTDTKRANPTPEPAKTIAVHPKHLSTKPLTDKPLSTKLTPKAELAPKTAARPNIAAKPTTTNSGPELARVETKRPKSTPSDVRRVSEAPATRPANPTQAEETPPTVSRSSVFTAVAGKRVTAEKTTKPKKRAVAPAPRQKPVEAPTSESDLERTLNKNQ